MDIEIKIHQGTGKLTGEPLCFSCTHVIRRGDNVACGLWGTEVYLTKPIYSCSKYYNASLPSRNDMEQIAWELKTTGGRKIGFYPPKKRTTDEPPDY